MSELGSPAIVLYMQHFPSESIKQRLTCTSLGGTGSQDRCEIVSGVSKTSFYYYPYLVSMHSLENKSAWEIHSLQPIVHS